MELQNLRSKLASLKNDRDSAAQQQLDTTFMDGTIREVEAHISDLEIQQNLQYRVDQAKETGYIADTLKANGIPLIELSHTPENYELTAIAFQRWALEQQDAFNTELKGMEQTLAQTTEMLRLEYGVSENHELTISQQNLEIKELNKKLANAAGIIEEKEAEIKRLKDQQNNPQAVEVAQLSAEEQETKLVADLMGNRLKVTDIRFKDESGLDRRKVLANNALTGEEIEEYAIYSKTRWEEISQEAAEQLRADYANKKAELEAQIAVIPTIEPEIERVNAVTEEEAPATEIPFQTDQVDTTESGLVDSTQTDNGESADEKSEVTYITQRELAGALNIMYNTIREVSNRVSELESQQAVA